MVSIPRASDCIGVVGVAVGVVGLVVSLWLVVRGTVEPWGWYLFVASGTLGGVSLLYCLVWEWDHLPFRKPG